MYRMTSCNSTGSASSGQAAPALLTPLRRAMPHGDAPHAAMFRDDRMPGFGRPCSMAIELHHTAAASTSAMPRPDRVRAGALGAADCQQAPWHDTPSMTLNQPSAAATLPRRFPAGARVRGRLAMFSYGRATLRTWQLVEEPRRHVSPFRAASYEARLSQHRMSR